MSVVEAMQLGLVPVVTPVGGMRSYCRDGENAILFADAEQAAARIVEGIADPATYRRLQSGALATFRDQPSYAEEVVEAARRLVGGQG